MNTSNYIRFEEYCTDRVTRKEIDYTESKIGLKFPFLFKKVVEQCDSGSVINSDFEYYDPYTKKYSENGLGRFMSLKSDKKLSVYDYYINPPEAFPKYIIAFCGNGGGDLICFDYRSDPTTDNPPIVLWLHEENEGEDVIFLANTFEEFLKMLKEPED